MRGNPGGRLRVGLKNFVVPVQQPATVLYRLRAWRCDLYSQRAHVAGASGAKLIAPYGLRVLSCRAVNVVRMRVAGSDSLCVVHLSCVAQALRLGCARTVCALYNRLHRILYSMYSI